MICKTTPQVVKTYKQIWDNIIKNDEEILRKTESYIIGNEITRTNYVDKKKEFSEEVKALHREQKRILDSRKG